MNKPILAVLCCLSAACTATATHSIENCRSLLADSAFFGAYRDACVTADSDEAGRYDSAAYFVGETLFKRYGCLQKISDAEIGRAVAAARTRSQSPNFCSADHSHAAKRLSDYEAQE